MEAEEVVDVEVIEANDDDIWADSSFDSDYSQLPVMPVIKPKNRSAPSPPPSNVGMYVGIAGGSFGLIVCTVVVTLWGAGVLSTSHSGHPSVVIQQDANSHKTSEGTPQHLQENEGEDQKIAATAVHGGNGGAIAMAASASSSEIEASGAQANNSPTVSVPSEISLKPGRLRVTVTYQYNQLVGNKPDTDSTIVLIPEHYPKKLESDKFHTMMLPFRDLFSTNQKKLRESGIYLGMVGGDGKALLDRVPPGNYEMIIISNNTKSTPASAKFKDQRLSLYFDSEVHVGLRNVHMDEITITSGEEYEYSHDFGLSNF